MSARSFRRDRQHRVERQAKRLRHLPAKAGAGAVAAFGATALFAPGARADTFTVDNLNDAGPGSLREAVANANADVVADQIVFQSGISGQITLATGDIDIYGPVDIQGPGVDQVTVSGNDLYRIFDIDTFNAGDQVSISGLTLSHGYNNGDGGALRAIASRLTLTDMVIEDSRATEQGGGVFTSEVELKLIDSVLTGNRADGSGDYGGGGAYIASSYPDGSTGEPVEIRGSVISENTTGESGGGVEFYDVYADNVIENTAIANNSSVGYGAGIAVEDLYDPGSLTIDRSTIANNATDDVGGGIAFFEDQSTWTIVDSTFSGNSASARGGALYAGNEVADPSSRQIRNSTFAGNSAGTSGGAIYLYSDEVGLDSTIVADNSAPEGPDLRSGETGAAVFSGGFNLIGSSSGVALDTNPAASNITGTDPLLGPLADNGGPTQTMLPATTSLAIDAGVANGLATDQRGLARTFDAPVPNVNGSDGTDIGAVELQADEVQTDCAGSPALKITGTEAGETLTGSDIPDAITGAGGDDTLRGLGANDCLSGEAGNDTADGGDGDDLISGGDANDVLLGQGGKDNLSGEGGNDKANGGAGKDKLTGGGGKDKLKGSGGKDKVSGGGGKDKINPGNGKDKVKAAGGKDKINTADGKKDKLNCGGGKDKAKVDAKDKVKANCDVVKVKG